MGIYYTTIECLNVSTEVRVEYDYQPEEKTVYYMPNGDPGYPGCPEAADIYLVAVENSNGTETNITDAVHALGFMDAIEADILEAIHEPDL